MRSGTRRLWAPGLVIMVLVIALIGAGCGNNSPGSPTSTSIALSSDTTAAVAADTTSSLTTALATTDTTAGATSTTAKATTTTAKTTATTAKATTTTVKATTTTVKSTTTTAKATTTTVKATTTTVKAAVVLRVTGPSHGGSFRRIRVDGGIDPSYFTVIEVTNFTQLLPSLTWSLAELTNAIRSGPSLEPIAAPFWE
jgi:cytoskeletal protein RodZ